MDQNGNAEDILMRWFKHMSESWDDTRLSSVVDAYGLVGYGFWWRLLEVIAGRMDGNEPPEHTLSLKGWSSLFRIYPKTFRKILGIFEISGLVLVAESKSMITVKVPNMLKYRDEWAKKKARNSGVPPEKLWSRESESESDPEEEKSRVVRPREPGGKPGCQDVPTAMAGPGAETRPPADPPEPSPDRPELAIIRAFDDARAEAFGPALRRAWPSQHDFVTAQRWLKAGADMETCRFVFAAACRAKAAKKEKPPDTLRYFDSAIADAITQKTTTLEVPDGHTEQTEPEDDTELVERLRAMGRERNAQLALVCRTA